MDSLKPSHKGMGIAGDVQQKHCATLDVLCDVESLVMLHVWLGYDEVNLGRMRQAIGDVSWLYPAIDRFAARLGRTVPVPLTSLGS
jgi:hypothetical protein